MAITATQLVQIFENGDYFNALMTNTPTKLVGVFESLATEINRASRSKTKTSKVKTKSTFDFGMVYDLYPLKKGKTKGLAICHREILTQSDFDDLLLAVNSYRQECLSCRRDPQYIKHFSTFMNNWRDYVPSELPRPTRGVLV